MSQPSMRSVWRRNSKEVPSIGGLKLGWGGFGLRDAISQKRELPSYIISPSLCQWTQVRISTYTLLFVRTKTTTRLVLLCELLIPFNDWLRASRLRLNATKTQVMWLGSPQQISQVDVSHVPVLSELIKVVESARDLGVVIDSHLSLSAYVATLCRSGFYHLRQLRTTARSL